jgi:hypothetical protein|tara:strand:+ start:347 stop:619 length:273 start_codon:yes stop_codon:yes gene_type:complete
VHLLRSAQFGENWIEFLESSTCGGNSCAAYALDVSGSVADGKLITVETARFFYDDVTDVETAAVWKTYNKLEAIRMKYDVEGFFYTEVFL